MLITTVTPVAIEEIDGIYTRSIDRIKMHLGSLEVQKGNFKIVPIICDMGHAPRASEKIKAICREFGAEYVHIRTNLVWSKPLCLNTGIRQSSPDSKFVATLDADLIYRDDTFANCVSKCCNAVVVSRSFFCTLESVETDFSRGSFSQIMRKHADTYSSPAQGGIQFFERDWLFKVKGYDERYSLWGGPDTEIKSRAERDGLTVVRLKFGMLIHLSHPRHLNPLIDEQTIRAYKDNNHKAYKTFGIKAPVRNKHWCDEKRIRGPRIIGGRVHVPKLKDILATFG